MNTELQQAPGPLTERNGSGAASKTAVALTEWARRESLADRVAVAALVADGDLVRREAVRAALVVTRDGEVGCDWERVGRRSTLLERLPAQDAAFLALVLAIALRTPLPLGGLRRLGDRRLALVLRALAALAESTSVTVGEPA
ncbi:hypothetical protein JNUCC64_09045 [Streptomyces sp. JNUCC 64]